MKKILSVERLSLTFYLEAGSFKGGSIIRAVHTVLNSPHAEGDRGKDISFVAMDPWIGDVNMWAWNLKAFKHGHDFLAQREDTGQPGIYEVFRANVIADATAGPRVLPIQTTALIGMKTLVRLLREKRITTLPQAIYLDSAHEKDETYIEVKY